MAKLIWGLFVLAVALWAGLAIEADPGYLFLSYQDYTIEAPLWLAALTAAVIALVANLIFKVFSTIFHGEALFLAYRQKKRQQRARLHTNRGLIELAEGRWAKAERYLMKGAAYAEAPLLNYLSAAKAAQAQSAHARRDDYLRQAFEVTEKADVAVSLTQAELQLDAGQYEQSLATLDQLRTMVPKHPCVLKMLKQIYLQLKDWQALAALLPPLRRYDVLTQAELAHLEDTVLEERFMQADVASDMMTCHKIWQQLPRRQQHMPRWAYLYANILLRHGLGDEAELVLRLALKKDYDESLALLYGQVRGPQVSKQLALAEQLLKSQEHSAALLLTCGRLSLLNQLWGKAQRYFEASLAIEKRPEAYAELGRLLEYMDKPELGRDCFRQGLLLTAPILPLSEKPQLSKLENEFET